MSCKFRELFGKFDGAEMASLPEGSAASLSLRHGVRCMAEPGVNVEDVLIAAGEQIGYDNICSASRMNKAVVIFVKEEHLVNRLISNGVVVSGTFITVSPLVTPTTRVTISNVPPFIKNSEIERALASYGKFASPVKMISLGCKNEALKHVLSFRRQVFMFLNEQDLNVSFRLGHEGKSYLVYASTGNNKCFECGDIGHKRVACPHKAQNVENTQQNVDDGNREIDRGIQPQAVSEVHDGGVAVGDSTRPSEEPTVVVNQSRDTERMMRADEVTVTAEVSGVGVEMVISEAGGSEIEPQPETSQGFEMSNDDNEMVDDDACSEISEFGSQVMGELYTLQEINDFLDVTFGKIVEVNDFFPDVDKFIASVIMLQRTVSHDELSKKKRFRLKKLLTKLRQGKSRASNY